MGCRHLLLLATTLLAAFSIALGHTRTMQGSRQGRFQDSLENRIKKYSDWAKYTTSHRRRLSNAASPVGQPPQPPVPSAGDFGGCKVLRYHTGYANITLKADKIIPDVPNFGTCCKLCSADPQCVAWTRVAGGDAPNFRKCYLKYSFAALDAEPGRLLNNHEGHVGDTAAYPELRYVDQSSPIILESGTTPDRYPADYYGCPYSPGNPTTPCVAPPTCNVDGTGKFIAPPCI